MPGAGLEISVPNISVQAANLNRQKTVPFFSLFFFFYNIQVRPGKGGATGFAQGVKAYGPAKP
jgi:hypothetical protein